MKLSKPVRKQFQAYGRTGGHTRAERMRPEARQRVARGAAIHRWTVARFGAATFAAAGLPGGEIIDSGLCALVAGEETIESLLVSLAAPRLRREGVPLPRRVFADGDSRLYRMLEQAHPALAHARYLAYLRQAASFAAACAGAREG